MNALRKIGRFLLRLWTFTLLLVGVLAIWGCSSVMPVTVHPLTDVILEGETPAMKMYGMDVTLNGIYKARLWPAREALPMILKDADRQDERSKQVADVLQQLLATSGLLSVGALPYAMKAVPKGYVKDA